MNTKTLQKQFSRIGVKFAVKPHEAVHHLGQYDRWRHRVHEPELRTKGRECVLVFEANFREQLTVEALCAPKSEDMLVLSLAWFNTRRVYLCRVVEERLEATVLPDALRKPLAHHIRDLERAVEQLNARKQSRTKRQQKCVALSFTAASQRAGLSEEQYGAYIRLANSCRNTKFAQKSGPVVAAYGAGEHNTYEMALLRIARHHRDWRQEPETWHSPSHNTAKAFSSLLAHLFVRYAPPAFLESVWFREKENWLPCYIEVARGANIRQVKALQFPLTKKMVHCMMQAPDRFTMEEAIRWGQVHGLGGNARFFANIAGTRIPTTDKCNPQGHAFWQTVLEWLLKHPMLAPGQYGPLIDFIRREKHQNSAYKVAGRSPQAMIRSMERWHRDVNKYRYRKLPAAWASHNLDWCWCRKDGDGHVHEWRVVEITTSERLRTEGMTMKHCVFSYGWACARGTMAIFSLQENGKPVLTVEYSPGTHKIGEVRGACNRVPTAAEWTIVQRWAMAKQIG